MKYQDLSVGCLQSKFQCLGVLNTLYRCTCQAGEVKLTVLDCFTDGDLYCKCLEEGTAEPEPTSTQSKRHKTMPPPTTPTGLEIASDKSLPPGVESLKPQTPTRINESMKSKSPNDMHFRVTNQGQESTGQSIGFASLTDLGYSSPTMIELFPQRSSCLKQQSVVKRVLQGQLLRCLMVKMKN